MQTSYVTRDKSPIKNAQERGRGNIMSVTEEHHSQQGIAETTKAQNYLHVHLKAAVHEFLWPVMTKTPNIL